MLNIDRCDLGGYRWPPTYSTGSNTVFHLGSFSTVFRVPNFWGHFEALNDVFLMFGGLEYSKAISWAQSEMCSSWLDLSNELSCAPNGDRMQKLHPREVDVSTTPIGAHKPFGVSSFGVRVLVFLYVKKAFGASL
jgi:hypothetical protein